MKRTITLRFLLSLCVLTLCSFLDRGGNIACAEEAKFVYTSSSTFSSMTVGDITVKIGNGSWYTTWNCVRLKDGNDLTVSCGSTNKITLKSATIIQYTIKGRFMSR
ncbi:MAG: hypothetical protein SPE09_08230 [Alloprevotella sp.]|nr:hypothetical protein [Alloprevotella sp.]